MLDDSLPSDPAALLNEWRVYFSTLLNNKNKNADATNLPAPSDDIPTIKTSKISRAEVQIAIDGLKRNKSPGNDYAMTAEIFKDGGKFVVDQLHELCQLVVGNDCSLTK